MTVRYNVIVAINPIAAAGEEADVASCLIISLTISLTVRQSIGQVRYLGVVGVDPVAAVGEEVDVVPQFGNAGAIAGTPPEGAPLRLDEADADAVLPTAPPIPLSNR